MSECIRCGGTAIDPEDSFTGSHGDDYVEPPVLEPCRDCVAPQQGRVNPHPMIDCPYFQGTGTCGGGSSCEFYGEPRCITEQPLRGWRRRTPDGRFAPKETSRG